MKKEFVSPVFIAVFILLTYSNVLAQVRVAKPSTKVGSRPNVQVAMPPKSKFPLLKPEDYKYYFLAYNNETKFDNELRHFTDYDAAPLHTSIYDVRTMQEVRPWYSYNRNSIYKYPVLPRPRILPSGDLFFVYNPNSDRSGVYVLTAPNGTLRYAFASNDAKFVGDRGAQVINEECNRIVYWKERDIWTANFDPQTGKFSGDRQVTKVGIFNSIAPWNWYKETLCIDDYFVNLSTGQILDDKQVPKADPYSYTYGTNEYAKLGPGFLSPNRRWIYLMSVKPEIANSDFMIEKAGGKMKDGTYFFDCQDFSIKKVAPIFSFDDFNFPFWVNGETFLAAPHDFLREINPNTNVAKYYNIYKVDLQHPMLNTTTRKQFSHVNIGTGIVDTDFLLYDDKDQKRIIGDFSWLNRIPRQSISASPTGKRIIIKSNSFFDPQYVQFGGDKNLKRIVYNSQNNAVEPFDILNLDAKYEPTLFWLDDERVVFSLNSEEVGVSDQGTYLYNFATKQRVKLTPYLLQKDRSPVVALLEANTILFLANGYLWKCNGDGTDVQKTTIKPGILQELTPFLLPNQY